jgi:DinB superfamily
MSATVDELIARLEAVERRLVEHADAPLPAGLTEPDPDGEERWEAGQVWAHLAEFPAYWLAQMQLVISLPTNEPVPFGRMKTDAGRVAAIERDRHTDPHALLARVRSALSEVAATARSLPPDAWTRRGQHPVRGEMTVRQIFERFVANHLEEHADQLDGLRRAG